MKDRKGYWCISVLCLVSFMVIILPLLILGYYDYPSADDWSLASITYHVLQDGGNIIDVLKSISETIMIWREKGEPRYASVFLASLQPGIFGEHFYRITPLLMIGSLSLSEIMFCFYLLKDSGKENKKYILPIIIPSLAVQMLCVPYPVETFYWYTGSVNYTFVFGFFIILITMFLLLAQNRMGKIKTRFVLICSMVIALVVGGNNYATSLSSVCIFITLSVILFFNNKMAFWRTLPITLVTSIGLIVCLVAPGNQVRLEEFGGTTRGAFYAVSMSLLRTGLNIYSWTTWKIVLMLILSMPFLWKALKEVCYSFRYPVIFTLFTFGIYASQIVATMYVDGTTGGRRMADILYYAYHVWVLLNAGYWMGWLQRKKNLGTLRFIGGAKEWIDRHLVVWFAGVGAILAIVICVTEIKESSTYRACAWLFKGYAKEYAAAWEERLVILNDESIKEVFFDPLPRLEEMVFYADFQPGENWINDACEVYYEKDYVGLK